MDNENIVLYDWVSIATKELDEVGIQALLGMENIPWKTIYGCYGFKNRLYYNGVGIHYDGREDQGVLVEMSGQGCRTFESLGNGNYERLFNFVNTGHGHINRLDVAYDDHTGVLDIEQIEIDAKAGNFVSRWRQVSGHWTDREKYPLRGQTVEHGSMKSDIMLRIYNKAAERGCEKGTHWIRAEMQLRGDRAAAFIADDTPLGERFTGVLCNYLRYVVPLKNDTNKSRWPVADYWADFLGDVVAIKLYKKPGMEYNISHLDNFVFQQAGNAIEAAIEIYGIDGFLHQLKSHKRLPNPKYKQIVDATLRLKPNFEMLSDDYDIPW